MKKQRLSVSVDADLVESAEAAAARGQVASVSAWVNDALRLKLEHDGRLQALAGFIEAFEGGHGAITPEEMRDAARRARSRAVSVRGLAAESSRARRGRGAR